MTANLRIIVSYLSCLARAEHRGSANEAPPANEGAKTLTKIAYNNLKCILNTPFFTKTKYETGFPAPPFMEISILFLTLRDY